MDNPLSDWIWNWLEEFDYYAYEIMWNTPAFLEECKKRNLYPHECAEAIKKARIGTGRDAFVEFLKRFDD